MLNEEGKELDELARVVTAYTVESKLKSKYTSIIEDEYHVNNKPAKLFRLGRLSIVACIIVLIIGSVLVLENNRKEFSHRQLAQNYLEGTSVFGNAEIMRKGLVEQNALRNKANKAYLIKDFESAVSIYNELKYIGTLSSLDQYYLGVSYLRISSFEQAIEVLYPLSNQSHGFSEEVDWLLGLAYILTDQKDESSIFLKRIVENKSYKHKEALRLLDSFK